jgi:hypothetical protein
MVAASPDADPTAFTRPFVRKYGLILWRACQFGPSAAIVAGRKKEGSTIGDEWKETITPACGVVGEIHGGAPLH